MSPGGCQPSNAQPAGPSSTVAKGSEGAGVSSGASLLGPGGAPTGRRPLLPPRPQTQRVMKGQSDLEWKENEPYNVFHDRWRSEFDWVERAGVDEAGETAFCTLCDSKSMQARHGTLLNHSRSQKHKDRVQARAKAQTAEEQAAAEAAAAAAAQASKEEFEGMLTGRGPKQDKTRMQQLVLLYYLLRRGRPLDDFKALKKPCGRMKVPHCGPESTSWTSYMAEELSRGIEAVTLEKGLSLIAAARFLSISMDEATTISKTGRLSVHAYVLVDWQRVPIFLEMADLVEAPCAEYLHSVLLTVLQARAGLGPEELAAKLVSGSADVASVMAGEQTGVLARLGADAPFLTPMHCMSHRTNLAAGAMGKAAVLQRVVSLLHNVHNFFSPSTKRLQELKAAAEEAGTEGNKPLKDVNTRWLSMHGPHSRQLSEYNAHLHFFTRS